MNITTEVNELAVLFILVYDSSSMGEMSTMEGIWSLSLFSLF